MSARSYLVTGGTGFIGAALVRRLVGDGFSVRVLDDDSRGAVGRLADIRDGFEFVPGDVRDAATVGRAARGVDGVFHLAAVNGTEFFYSKPELVLDVGVKGMLNVVDACRAEGVGELILASSSEVYQTPPTVPTDETAPLIVPDPMNARYSYGGAKIISELIAVNYGRTDFDRVVIFRPHNVYGPDMGWEHVLPQFVLRLKRLADGSDADPLPFPIRGDGSETRAFTFIDDLVDGVMVMVAEAEHLGIYHVGNPEEVAIRDVAHLVGDYFGRAVEVVPGTAAAGGTPRRCPDITRLAALGFRPRTSLVEGLPALARWYDENAGLAPPGAAA